MDVKVGKQINAEIVFDQVLMLVLMSPCMKIQKFLLSSKIVCLIQILKFLLRNLKILFLKIVNLRRLIIILV